MLPRVPPSITLSPQHLLGLDASLLDHDQGVEIHCPLPWCVMKVQALSSELAGSQTQAGNHRYRCSQ